MNDRLWIAFCAAVVGFALTSPVFIQVAYAQSGAVDLSPTANSLIGVAVAVLTVAAGVVSKFVVSFLASKTKLTDSAFEKLMAERVNDILLRSIDHAEMWARQQVADPNSSIREVRVDNVFLRVAVEYAQKSMPDLIQYFKLTPDRIADMIKARLNAFVSPPVANTGIVTTTPTL